MREEPDGRVAYDNGGIGIKVPSGENTELKRSPFTAWSRSVYSRLLRLLPGISSLLISILPVHSPVFFPKPLPIFFLCWLLLTHGFFVGPQNKTGHHAGCRFPWNINRLKKL